MMKMGSDKCLKSCQMSNVKWEGFFCFCFTRRQIEVRLLLQPRFGGVVGEREKWDTNTIFVAFTVRTQLFSFQDFFPFLH